MARDSAPTVLEEVLAPAWLTEALGPDGNPGHATDVTVTEHLRTVATKVRFDVVSDGSGGPGVTRSYCVKGYFEAEESRRGGGHPEALFYDVLASTLGIRVPRCPY